MTYQDRTTEQWVNALDDMGPFAPVQALKAMLETAPPDAPADLVGLLRQQIAEKQAKGLR